MTDSKEFSKDGVSNEPTFKETSSPKLYTKKEKSKYQAFRSDDEDSSENDELDSGLKRRRKVKKEKSNAFKVKIKKSKGKKKEKDKEKEKEKKKKTKKSLDGSQADLSDEPLHEPVFGVPLEIAIERSALPDKIPLPRVVRECIIYIEESGLEDEGLYRLSAVKSKVDYLKQLYNEGRPVNLQDYDATTVASLLKLYLRELPSNILTTRLVPIFDSCVSMEDPREQAQIYQQLINDLPCGNRTLLGWLFVHFGHVMDKNSETKMNIQNLSIVFSPTMSISHGVLNLLFIHSKELFPEVKLVRYEPIVAPNDEKELLMPDTIEGLQEILQQNEEVLAELHDRVNQCGSEDESLMDELWERQRWSTQIKRKIKTLKKAEKEKGESNDTLDEVGNQTQVVDTSAEVEKSVEVDKRALESNDSSDKTCELADGEKPAEDISTSMSETKEEFTKEEITKEESSWKAELILSDESEDIKENKFGNFNEPDNEGFANFNETANATFSDFSSNNEFLEEKEEDVVNSSGEVLVSSEDDEDYKSLVLEERKLTIENEELLSLKELLSRKIERELLEIERLKERLSEHQDGKGNYSSSCSSSSSSRNSLNSDSDSNSSESEENNSELELIANELEEDNKRLQMESKELIEKICKERLSCATLRTEIRISQIMNLSLT